MDSGTKTRLVDCPVCGDTAAYIELPEGATVMDDEPAERSAEANCLECDHSFRVFYSLT